MCSRFIYFKVVAKTLRDLFSMCFQELILAVGFNHTVEDLCGFEVLIKILPEGILLHQDKDGWNLLHLAAKENSISHIKFLLKSGPPEYREVQTVKGLTALHLASLSGKCQRIVEGF
eukprot:TRINITY_DN1878_c1_g1_i4.p1 TRINITY_DN1878_c1_g1~~TRINITY_DN1878_c1_g1_i4.p1  ORF type:complete len:117 (-),score=21.63 TRINITY_DN1878_c1_g1_i4:249-599(-)